MAGDWIPMRLDLDEDPAVVGVAALLGVSELHIVGCLWKLWSLASRQTVNGWLPNYTASKVDAVVSLPGFTAALESLAWLQHRSGGLTIPSFEKWLGESSKKRMQEAVKKRRQRASASDVPIVGDIHGDKNGTTSTLLSSQERHKKEKRVNTADATNFPANLDTPEFRESWTEWYTYRIEKHAKLTPSSIKKQLAVLAKIGAANAIETINQSITNGWQGLFPEKLKAGNPSTSGQPKQTILTDDEIAHGDYNGITGFTPNTRTCKKPDCQRAECVASREANDS